MASPVSYTHLDVYKRQTLALFAAVYVFLFIGWARVISRFIERGPVGDAAPAAGSADDATAAVKEGE